MLLYPTKSVLCSIRQKSYIILVRKMLNFTDSTSPLTVLLIQTCISCYNMPLISLNHFSNSTLSLCSGVILWSLFCGVWLLYIMYVHRAVLHGHPRPLFYQHKSHLATWVYVSTQYTVPILVPILSIVILYLHINQINSNCTTCVLCFCDVDSK